MSAEAGQPGSVEQAWMSSSPAARTSITIGPPLLEGTRSVHVVADHLSGGYLRLGEREAFILAHLDGTRSLSQIGRLYAERFGRRLDGSHWQQLLTLFARHALVEPADPALLASARERAERTRRESGRTLFRYRMPVPGAASAAGAAAPYLSWMLHPALVAVVTVAGVAATAVLLLDWRDLGAAAGGPADRWSAAALALLLTWVLVAGHEVGHAIACVRYGGRPTELGVMWRAPLLTPYCKVDDVVTFPRAGQRLMTAYAGVYVNIAAQPVLLLLWTRTDPGPWWSAVLAFVVIGNSACIVVNLLPVLHLDGYHMVEHAARSIGLQRETVRFVSGAVRERSSFVARYEPRARWTYSSYALLAFFLLGPMVATMVGSWYVTMAGLWGPAVSASVLLAEAVVLVLVVRWGLAWQRRRDEQAGTGAGRPVLPVPAGPSDLSGG